MSGSPAGTAQGTTGALLWQPSEAVQAQSRMRAYLTWLSEEHGLHFDGYSALWEWSVRDLPAFWQSIWDYFGVIAHTPAREVLADARMPGASWFPGATLNYAEHALQRRAGGTAVIYRGEEGVRTELGRAELAERVARAAAGLRRLGVGKGDRVVAFMPNAPETLIAFLATASLGAIWSSCSPEFGVQSVLDRFRQIEPKVLLAVDGYVYGGKRFDRSDALSAIRGGLPMLEHTVVLSRIGQSGTSGQGSVLSFDELLSRHEPLAFEAVPFDHPLWILYSSGTTGLPKPIVQGHGGILLEHYKALALHCDLGESDRFFWFTTTGWMMWNFLISGLLVGATIVLYDGSPAHPDLGALWALAEQETLTYFGTSAPFLLSCKKAELSPAGTRDLSRLRSLGTTGAPLPADGFDWVYAHVSADLLLGSISGGTDVCTAFVLSCPLLPVYAGEIQCRALGAKVEAYDAAGASVTNQVGELVVSAPMPSMPVCFWNDAEGRRYHDSYFAAYPGVWRHGDWILINERGGSIIYGRSDSTLNRGGVRMGTSEFYRVVDGLPEVSDSLVIDTGSLEDSAGKLWLFLVLAAGKTLDAPLAERIKATIRRELSPRHVPDEIRAIPEVPRTLNGKKLEVPIKRILTGTPLERAVSPDTLANPRSLQAFVELANVSSR
ncbi:MAG TPA: acetoacetate--CoA ligase [Polyangiaceae bacterium]